MRALVPPEDRLRFERLIAELEQAVGDSESVTADLARLLAIAITEAPVHPTTPVELTDVVTAALRAVDTLLVSRDVVVDIEAQPAVFAMGDRDRLEQLIATALSICAYAAPPGTRARLSYGVMAPDAVVLSLTPYRAGDPRRSIVEALARAQRLQVAYDDVALTVRLPAPVGAASV